MRRLHDFLTKLMAGNKSGALLLTNFELTPRRDNEGFTIRLTVGAVRDGNGNIGEARLNHPTFNRIRALP